MKNIEEILASVGITVPEDKKSDFEAAFNENYKTVSEAEKLRTARDNYKSQLETAQNALKEFEGVDVKDLQGKIDKLNSDLAQKDSEYQSKIADMEFNTKLDGLINKAGAKNAKAVKALLDVDALKASKNQDADLQAALDTCKAENNYLFGSDEPINNPVASTQSNPSVGALDGIRAAMGLSTDKK